MFPNGAGETTEKEPQDSWLGLSSLPPSGRSRSVSPERLWWVTSLTPFFSLGPYTVDWLSIWLLGWLAEWLVEWLAGELLGWLSGWVAGWLVGWLSGVSQFWITCLSFSCGVKCPCCKFGFVELFCIGWLLSFCFFLSEGRRPHQFWNTEIMTLFQLVSSCLKLPHPIPRPSFCSLCLCLSVCLSVCPPPPPLPQPCSTLP